MKKRKSEVKKRRTVLKVTAMLSVAAMISIYFMVMVSAQCSYTITDGDTVTYHTSSSTEVREVLREAGIRVQHDDLVTSSSRGKSTNIHIQRSQYVSINYEGNRISTATYDETVGRLLENLCLSVSSTTKITVDGVPVTLDTRITDGMNIDVVTSTTKTRVETVTIPYETHTYQDPGLDAGETVVKTVGAEGQKEITYTDTYVGGELTGSMVAETKILSNPVDEVILIGSRQQKPTEDITALEVYVEPTPTPTPVPTPKPAAPAATLKPSSPPAPAPTPAPAAPSVSANTITTSSGEVITYTKSLSVTATAYCLKGTTASGTQSRYGAIAVDPSVIPLGTKMYIVSDDGKWIYGYATAEDTGGAIKGNKIDLFYDSYDTCIQFGRRSCTVYILG